MEKEKLRDYFKGKKILVTGGTGSFGNQIITRLIPFHPERIVVFSRDEDKQYRMQRMYEEHKDILEFVIGDIRDYNQVREVMVGCDVVYHAAALKQVPNCEFHPMEAVKTNILGAENVRRAAQDVGVEAVVAISTDKAVEPASAMGMSKAIQEKIFLNPRNIGKHATTRFICVRYGNIIGSRGSVVPLFRELIREGKSLRITSPNMTRFLLLLEEAAELIFFATIHAKSGELVVRKMPSCSIGNLAQVMAKEMTGRDDYPIEVVGIRPGEKMHEALVSEEEMLRAVEHDVYYVIRPYAKEEDYINTKKNIKEFASNNANTLNKEELKNMLQKSGWLGKEEVRPI